MAVVVSAGSMELVLRVFVPRYAGPASAHFDSDAARMVTRRPHSKSTYVHPDTGVKHFAIYNGLGLRQHREIALAREPAEVRVGIFGDSYTENTALPAAHTYPEILDYLLNESEGPSVTVLNFGMNGYGLGQAFFAWRHALPAQDLDHVIYLFCANDIRNLYENQLFELTDEGTPRALPPPQRPWWVPLVTRFHLTYLLMDAIARFGPGRLGGDWPDVLPVQPLDEQVISKLVRKHKATRIRDETADRIEADVTGASFTPEVERYLDLAAALVDTWGEETHSRGESFRVVLLPQVREARLEQRIFSRHDVLNLHREFATYAFEGRPWGFRNDGHWNELGNLLAAVHLYRELAPEIVDVLLSDHEIARALHIWYTAFPGFEPSLWTEPHDVVPARVQALRRHYIPLELVENDAIRRGRNP